MPTDRTVRDPLIGQLFAGRYQVERRIGSGGMGNIYRAVHKDMGRPVALKLLHPDLGGDAEIVGRFNREMKAATRIEHPNSVRIYEHGQAPDGTLYLAMELLEGRALSDVVTEEAPLAPDRTAHVGMQIAQALAAAHAEKIVHRDLKPENIMLIDRYGQKDYVKVLDFGLSRTSGDDGEGDAGLTQVGVRVGTPMYMAPEYVSAFQFDARSDLYALGVILYEAATGRSPFTGRPYEILDKQVNEKPRPPREISPATVPPWLDDVVTRLLAKDPAARPQTALEVANALERGRAMVISQPQEDAVELAAAVAAVTQAAAAPPKPPEPPPEPSPPVLAAAPPGLVSRARTGRTGQISLPSQPRVELPVEIPAEPSMPPILETSAPEPVRPPEPVRAPEPMRPPEPVLGPSPTAGAGAGAGAGPGAGPGAGAGIAAVGCVGIGLLVGVGFVTALLIVVVGWYALG